MAIINTVEKQPDLQVEEDTKKKFKKKTHTDTVVVLGLGK